MSAGKPTAWLSAPQANTLLVRQRLVRPEAECCCGTQASLPREPSTEEHDEAAEPPHRPEPASGAGPDGLAGGQTED